MGESVHDRLIDTAREGRLVVFVGAGVSTLAPSCLPSWPEVNRAVMEAISERSGLLIGLDRARQLGAAVTARQRAARLPPEYQAQIVAERLRESYFEVLQCLDGEVPNAVHLALAASAKAGLVKAILTTNFDRLLEAAFSQTGAARKVYYRKDQFAELAMDLDRCGVQANLCLILKLHGSAEDPTTLVDTLAQRKAGFPRPTVTCLRHLLRFGHWLFLGYSGADLAAEPNYLELRAAALEAQGFTWLVRTGDEPLPAVVRTREVYGERAAIVHGELPQWLESVLAPVLPGPPPVPQPETGADVVRRRASDAVALHARRWSEAQRPEECVLALADLLEAADQPAAALEVLNTVYEGTPETERQGGHFGVSVNNLANLHSKRGNYEQALRLFEEALAIFKQLNTEEQRVGILNNMALISEKQGRYEEALKYFGETLATCERTGNHDGRSVALHNLAMIQGARGDFDEADRLYQEAFQVARELGDEPGMAEVLNNLGELSIRREQPEAALEQLGQALAIRGRLGDERGRAITLGNIANVHLLQGRHEEAERLYREGRAIFERFDDKPYLATALGNLAEVARVRRNFEEAIALLQEALALADQASSEPARAWVLERLAKTHADSGRIDEALDFLRQSLAIRERIGAPAPHRDGLMELGFLHQKKSALEEAEKCFREALSITERLGQQHRRNWVRIHLANVLNLRGLATQQQGRHRLAVQLFREAIELHELLFRDSQTADQKRAATYNRGQTLMNVANTHVMAGELDASIPVYVEALAALDQAGDRDTASTVICTMAEVHFWCGRNGEAIGLFREAGSRNPKPSAREKLRDRMGNLARRLAEQHLYDGAIELYGECLRINEELMDAAGIAATKFNLGYLLLQVRDEPAAALPLLEDAASAFQLAGHELAAAAQELLSACRARLAEAGPGAI